MKARYYPHPDAAARMTANELREAFHVSDLMKPNEIVLHYSSFDRFIFGSAIPVNGPLALGTYDALKADHFLQRRELGILNTGGPGIVKAGQASYTLQKADMLYLGKGTGDVVFESIDSAHPAKFYLNSAPAHATHPNRMMTRAEANRVDLGQQEFANRRTLYQYIHEGGIQSCQLVMGFTELASGNIWNTFPPHTHDRRMEVYFYFDLPQDQLVIHLMGTPEETRHIILQNEQAVVSPPWSIHAGAGTAAYRFVWGMAGENKAFTDMDMVPYSQLK